MVKQLLEDAKAKNVKFVIPVDTIVAKEMTQEAESKLITFSGGNSNEGIPDGYSGFDIGPKTLELFKDELLKSKTVIWNGPMGVFEVAQFANGTNEIAKLLADVTSHGGTTIVGGGDSVAAVHAAKLGDSMTHMSTGGGASLEMLEGKPMPGVACLDDDA